MATADRPGIGTQGMMSLSTGPDVRGLPQGYKCRPNKKQGFRHQRNAYEPRNGAADGRARTHMLV